MEEGLISRIGFSFRGIPAGGLHGVGAARAARNGVQLVRGLLAAWSLLGRERPAALLTSGGYVSVPVALAAWARRVPILLYLPDIEPAQSVRLVSRLATQIGATVEDSRAYLPADKVVVTGYPLRESVLRWTKPEARRTLGLAAEEPVLLVFGGSRGARSLNRAVVAHVSELLPLTQVLHISGELDWTEVSEARQALPQAERERYHVYAYLHEEMGAALAAADLAVSRAGASILGESPYFGLPSILVPYPYAWRYQKVNAEWLAGRGAAVVVEDEALPDALVPLVRELLQDETRRTAMGEAARQLARPDAARQLASLLMGLPRGEVK